MTAARKIDDDDAGDFQEPSNTYFNPRRPQQRHADVVPFPIARRHHFINNAFMSATEHREAGKCRDGQEYLRGVVKRYGNRLQQIGVSSDRIATEMRDAKSILLGEPNK